MMVQNLQTLNWFRFILLTCWAVLLILGLWGNNLLPVGLSLHAGAWGKMGSSLTLVALGALAIRQVPLESRRYASLITGGMLLGAVGDFFNADLLSFITKQGTLGAIVAFGIGHLLYIAAIVGRLRLNGPFNISTTIAAITFWQVVGLGSWYWIVYQGQKAREIVWPALGYCLLLAGTTGIATSLALRSSKAWTLALGASLFLMSDLILAVAMFRESFAFRSEAVWLTYGPGQMFIVNSCWLFSSCQPVDRGRV